MRLIGAESGRVISPHLAHFDSILRFLSDFSSCSSVHVFLCTTTRRNAAGSLLLRRPMTACMARLFWPCTGCTGSSMGAGDPGATRRCARARARRAEGKSYRHFGRPCPLGRRATLGQAGMSGTLEKTGNKQDRRRHVTRRAARSPAGRQRPRSPRGPARPGRRARGSWSWRWSRPRLWS